MDNKPNLFVATNVMIAPTIASTDSSAMCVGAWTMTQKRVPKTTKKTMPGIPEEVDRMSAYRTPQGWFVRLYTKNRMDKDEKDSSQSACGETFEDALILAIKAPTGK